MSLSIFDGVVVISLKVFKVSEKSRIQNIRNSPEFFERVLDGCAR